MITAEVITIGDEILYGHITDTNSQYISKELGSIGIPTVRKLSIGDNAQIIAQAVHSALSSHRVVITTGGLGPTKDDLTKRTLAEYFGVGMKVDEPTLEHVKHIFTSRNRPLLDINLAQAEVPQNAEVLFNSSGTAPGMWFEANGSVLVCLPGVPFEMQHLMREKVLPKLTQRFETPPILHRLLHTVGIGESFIAEQIKTWEEALPPYMKLAYLPSLGKVTLRLTAVGLPAKQAQAESEALLTPLRSMLGEYIYATDTDQSLEQTLGLMLVERKSTLSTAESCTGGHLAHAFTSIPGSSAYFLGGVVAYHNEVKQSMLEVPLPLIQQHGAVSIEVAIAMAEGVRRTMHSTYSIATTGIAGPSGGSPEKPVGTICIAVAGPNGTQAHTFYMSKFREVNIKLGTVHALNMLRKELLKY